MKYSSDFINALKENNLNAIKKIPKADLHNHFVLGGSRKFLQNRTGFIIEPIKCALSSMDDMHKWTNENVGDRFDNPEMRRLLIEATFVQAKEDGVVLLEIGEDVLGLAEYFSNDIEELISAFLSANYNS